MGNDTEVQRNDIDVNPGFLTNEKRELLHLLSMYADCYATLSKVQQTPMAKYICTDEMVHSIRQIPYHVSLKKRAALQDQVQEVLAVGIIQPMKSPWTAPVVLMKKNGSSWFCVNYQ